MLRAVPMVIVVLVSLLPLVVLGGLTAMALPRLARWRAAHDAGTARAGLATAANSVSTVAGTLVVDGDGCEDRGLPASLGPSKLAAVTWWFSRHRLWLRRPAVSGTSRAVRLRVETAEGSLRLVGAVTVMAGSRFVCAGPDVTGFQMASVLCDGDRVLVQGVHVRDTDIDAQGYRGADARVQLIPDASLGAILVAAEGTPKAFLRAREVLRNTLLLCAMAVGLVSGAQIIRRGGAVETRCAELCERIGQCETGLGTPSRVVKGELFACHATDADCRRSDVCRDSGQCSAVAGQCQAAHDEDCAHTTSCRDLGWCSAVAGQCRATKDAECKSTPACASLGYCSVDATGNCSAQKDEDCQASKACFDGVLHCAAENGKCVSSSAACQASEDCARYGKCIASLGPLGGCGVDEASCRRSRACVSDGRCTPVGNTCVARSEADCVRSSGALNEAVRIDPDLGECRVEYADTCEDSIACRALGRCGRDVGGGCKPRSESDCRASTECKERGQCHLVGDECAAGCATTIACRTYGRCSVDAKGRCIASSEADCHQSRGCIDFGSCTLQDRGCVLSDKDPSATPQCRELGECSVGPNQMTAAMTDRDCQSSDACRVNGRCTAVNGQCVARRDEDCLASRDCAASGSCSALRGSNRCVHSTAESCRARPACKAFGRCSATTFGVCAAASDEDCKQSDLCARYGWCNVSGDGVLERVCTPKRAP